MTKNKKYETLYEVYKIFYYIFLIMKKILVILWFFLFSVITVFAFTTLNRNNNIIECPSELYGDIVKYWVPSTTWAVPSVWSSSCNNYFYYSFQDYVKTYIDWTQTLCNSPKDRVIWWDQASHTITCRKWYDVQQNINVVSSDLTNLGDSNSRLKVSWIVWTNGNWSNITSNQAWNVKIIKWSFDKAKIKSDIISRATMLSNSVLASNTDVFSTNNNIVDFSNLSSSSNNWGVITGSNKNIKLFKTNKVVTIWADTYSSSPISVSWKKTLIIYWGDLYINRDMYYQSNNSILWIIVLKDKNWKWWNVFINPSVTNIVGTIFAQKSVLSASVTNFSSNPQSITYYDWTNDNNYLRNQLYIYWSLFSENTIWGSISPYKCPYYISTCTQSESIKYDLNYLRNYFLYKENKAWTAVSSNIYVNIPYNNWKKAGWINCDDSWSCTSGISQLSKLTSVDDGYSVVIKYNPNIQTNPPPLFSSN